jgi:hypothetical protein
MTGTDGWMTTLSLLSALCLAAPLPAQQPAAPTSSPHSEEGCEAYTWDLAREFAAMKKPATLLAASADPRVNPVRLEEGRRFAATLVPQGSVNFAATPARQRNRENPTAGLLFFKTGAAGRYRISLSSRHWIDVLDRRRSVDSQSHQGRGGCEALRKVVEFELPAKRDLVVQLSGDAAVTVDVLVTRVGKK